MTVSYRKDWEKCGDIARLISALNDGTKLTDDGGLQFIAGDHSELFDLLAGGFIGVGDLNHVESSSITRRKFLDLRRQGRVGKEALLQGVKDGVRSALAEPKKRYAMWTKLRLQNFHANHRTQFQIDDASIEFIRYLPRYLRLEEHFVSGVGRVYPNVLPFYGYAIVRVDARNIIEAGKKLFDAIDLLFSIINTSWRTLKFWKQRHPDAKLWEGPNQFIFENKKFLGNETVWYNPDYREEEWNRFPSSASDFYKRRQSFKKLLGLVQRHPLRPELSAALRSVSMGMESQNLSYRLMRYWSAAEVLYAPKADKTNSRQIIDRLTFADKEENIWLDRLKLDAAYSMRNSYVHQGLNENDTSLLVQNLRENVLRHVYYLIYNGADIRSVQELVDMTSLPRTATRLNEISVAIDRRKKILETGSHKSR